VLGLPLQGDSKVISFLLEDGSCSIYSSRKEIGYGKIAGSDEKGFGVNLNDA
jgi:hypothetical protein